MNEANRQNQMPNIAGGAASAAASSHEDQVFMPPLSEFKILEMIAEGGMGLVYKVYDRVENRICALKVLNTISIIPSERNEEIARFKREAKLAMNLAHPHLISAQRMGCEKGMWYYTMEFVPGGDLGEVLDNDETMTEIEVLDMAIIVAEVLDYIDQRGMVHRDIKPDNILCAFDGTLKVCDYGLMRQRTVSNSITAQGISLGTPNYMSPEQARGNEDLDIRSDIYALGVTMFHLLTGHAPFDSTSVTITLTKHLFEEMPDIRSFRKEISASMAALIAIMTQKDPEDRYQSAARLKEDLEMVRNHLWEKKTGISASATRRVESSPREESREENRREAA